MFVSFFIKKLHTNYLSVSFTSSLFIFDNRYSPADGYNINCANHVNDIDLLIILIIL